MPSDHIPHVQFHHDDEQVFHNQSKEVSEKNNYSVSSASCPLCPSTGSLAATVRVITAAVVVIMVVLIVSLGLVISVTVRVNHIETTKGSEGTSNRSNNGTKTRPTPTVVFATKSANNHDIWNGKVLKFTTVMTNMGGGYDRTTGMFTAPHSGTYLFHTSVCAQKKKWVFVHLMARGNSLETTGLLDNEAHGSCTSATGIAVLSRGEQAWVEGAWNETGALYIDARYSAPTFTGVLLHTGTC